MIFLRQSTASQEVMLGPFLDTDGAAVTGLTIASTDVKLFKAGATSEANKNSGGATHVAGGRYYCVLDATDTDTIGSGEINVHVAGALPVRRAFVVLHANVFDVLFGAVAPSTHTAAAVQALVAAGAVASVTGNVGGDVAGKVLGGGAGTITGTGARADVRAWNGTAPGNLDGNGFVPANVGAVNGNTTRATTFATGLDAGAIATWTAAGLRTAVGLASADLDTQLDAIAQGVADKLDAGDYVAPLDAAGVRAAVGLAAADLDAQLGAIGSDTAAILADTGTDGVVVASGSKSGYSIAADGLDAVAIEAGTNARQALALIAGAAAGVISGADGSTVTILGVGVATTRITATVDATGRTAVTLNRPS